QLQPALIATASTPAGGDMGAHVWAPAYLRDHLLPHGRITGWTPDWYAGFPAFHYYFPLPSLLIVLLDVVLPYGVAFKVVAVSGLVLLPVAAAAAGRALRLPFPTPPLMGVATVMFVFDRYHTIWGGNAAATLAGEFAFSISLALALFFVAALARALETGRGRVLAGVLFGATALSHLLPAAFAVGAAVVLLLLRRPDRARWQLVITSGLLGLALSAFWFVPFIGRLRYSNDMGWERTQLYLHNLLPFLREDQDALTTTAHLKVFFPLALVGVVLGLLQRRRGVLFLTIVALAAAAGFRFVPEGPIWNARFLPFWYLGIYLLGAVAVAEMVLAVAAGSPRVRVRPKTGGVEAAGVETADAADAADGAEWPAPVVPAYEPEPAPEPVAEGRGLVPALGAVAGLVAVVVLAGMPLGVFATGSIDVAGRQRLARITDDLPLPDALTPSILEGRIPVPTLGGGGSFVPGWARWNFSGYEAKTDYPEYRELIDTMDRLGRQVAPDGTSGCGRAMWEYEPELNRHGTPMGLMLLPYFTDGCIGSMEGLFFESSATVPYHFLNQSELSKTPSRAMRGLPYRDLDVAAGVDHLRLLGVRYYMAISPEAQAQAQADPDLELVATTSPRQITYSDGAKERFWQVYRVRDSDLVAPLGFEPVVFTEGAATKHGWLEAAVAWYQDPSRWSIPLASGGPRSWPRIGRADAYTPARSVPQATVTHITESDDRITFDVDRTGTPVVVRASYFPNWKVEGALGPWRVTPNLMVVVPTRRHVELHYGWTGLDLAAIAFTLTGLAAAVVLARRGRVALPEPPVPPEHYVDPFAVPAPRPAADGQDQEGVLTGSPRYL
ncbi:MAG TPA: 6-pyruvoyl-tetrahydropterin synthase-related protein, partial [Acidimicrobiales bacterium]|nr:6-pyruvoyl-tetrahydropterin synthase-related protein [Acidimicrobiales bacterium]